MPQAATRVLLPGRAFRWAERSMRFECFFFTVQHPPKYAQIVPRVAMVQTRTLRSDWNVGW